METVVRAQHTAVTLADYMAQQLDNLEMQVEDLSNHSRCNNLRIRGLPESPNEGPLAAKLEDFFMYYRTYQRRNGRLIEPIELCIPEE
ncbi:Hypothetical predicted protein [Pelobates cultripes]|uniref:Uncharacterized protein n=1 Tax=Pelobates cultripes TaxID=61616 RepID=A0AAD1SMX4_PELCU|nr:Hypothetical predicted protein [Pelobates cultripes]